MKMTTDPRPGPADRSRAHGGAAHGGRADSSPAGLGLAGGGRAARRTAWRHAARFVGFAPAVWLASTPVLWVLGAGPDGSSTRCPQSGVAGSRAAQSNPLIKPIRPVDLASSSSTS